MCNPTFKSKTFIIKGICSNSKSKRIQARARSKDIDPWGLIGHLRHSMNASDGNDERKELEYIFIDIYDTKFRFAETITFQAIQKNRRVQPLQMNETDCPSYSMYCF